MSFLVLLGIIAVVAFYAISIYNGLVTSRNGYKNAFAQIDVQLTRRYDLIPNLVETVKGYAKHEQDTLTAVIEARAKATSIQVTPETLNNPEAFAKFQAAQGELSSALSRLMVTVERYPDLKANTNFQQLQTELSSTEDRIAYARQYYNDNVRAYNTKIQSFPSVVVANMFKFEERQYFQADDQSRGNVAVDFGA